MKNKIERTSSTFTISLKKILNSNAPNVEPWEDEL